MSRFTPVGNVDVSELYAQLLENPDIWNRNSANVLPTGPHRETSIILLHTKDETENLEFGFSNFSDAHDQVWYQAVETLPAAKKIAHTIMSALEGEVLGGVVIYKVPPGKMIYPHIDTGWHSEFYSKINVCIESNDSAFFGYIDEACVQRQGECHYFENNVAHGVVNEGKTDHIILVVCIRLDSKVRVPFSTPSRVAKVETPIKVSEE